MQCHSQAGQQSPGWVTWAALAGPGLPTVCLAAEHHTSEYSTVEGALTGPTQFSQMRLASKESNSKKFGLPLEKVLPNVDHIGPKA